MKTSVGLAGLLLPAVLVLLGYTWPAGSCRAQVAARACLVLHFVIISSY